MCFLPCPYSLLKSSRLVHVLAWAFRSARFPVFTVPRVRGPRRACCWLAGVGVSVVKDSAFQTFCLSPSTPLFRGRTQNHRSIFHTLFVRPRNRLRCS